MDIFPLSTIRGGFLQAQSDQYGISKFIGGFKHEKDDIGIALSDGSLERLRCRATYRVAYSGTRLQQTRDVRAIGLNARTKGVRVGTVLHIVLSVAFPDCARREQDPDGRAL
jgi:hypothetical protein